MVDIIEEVVNRIRLNNEELILLKRILGKINTIELTVQERDFYLILKERVKGRLKILKIEV